MSRALMGPMFACAGTAYLTKPSPEALREKLLQEWPTPAMESGGVTGWFVHNCADLALRSFIRFEDWGVVTLAYKDPPSSLLTPPPTKKGGSDFEKEIVAVGVLGSWLTVKELHQLQKAEQELRHTAEDTWRQAQQDGAFRAAVDAGLVAVEHARRGLLSPRETLQPHRKIEE